MAIDKNNIVYSLLASTILANLDRQVPDKLEFQNDFLFVSKIIDFNIYSSNISEDKITLNSNVEPLHLPTEISHLELLEAELKTEEKKETVLENQPTTPMKKTSIFEKIKNRIWYTRPVSDEGDVPDETQNTQTKIETSNTRIAAPDIDTAHSTNVNELETINEKEKPGPIPSWLDEQVYGDKVRE